MTDDKFYLVPEVIGALLSHPIPRSNTAGWWEGRMNSTIRVDQWKTKFFDVRIYCTLADSDKVAALAAKIGVENDDAQRRWCLVNDAVIYRNAYIVGILFAPAYADNITGGADYPALLAPRLEDAEPTGAIDADVLQRVYARSEPWPTL
jgi:hypothetical protein